MATATRIPPNWLAWIAENKSIGVTDTRIVEILVENGFDPQAAAEEVHRPPSLKQAAAPAQIPTEQKLEKLQSLLEIYSDLWSLHPTVDRRPTIPRDEFFRNYYSVNRPIVLTGLYTDSPALALWSPEYLKARCGREMVEVMTGRASDRDYEINSNSHKTRMKFSDYADKVNAARETNDFYMVANNRNLEAPAMRSLMGEVNAFDSILDPAVALGRMFLWFGPRGTVTPLHHDTSNIVLAQVYGRKMITLIPSFQTPLVYNHIGVYSPIDPERPEYDRYPLFRKATQLKVLLEPGHALFIPVGWWHHVRSLDISISLSFTNFRAPNTYHWD